MNVSQTIGVIACCATLAQIALMGFIGYPIARKTPGGMQVFHRSGLIWWVITLLLITLLGLVFLPSSRELFYPSQHDPSIIRIIFGASIAFILCLLIELVGERILLGAHDSERRISANAKYESALPIWGRTGISQYILLVVVAALEEFVFRSVALGSFLYEWNLPKEIAAGIVAITFGFSHWYYGFRQITIKLIVGSFLVWASLTGGWLAAAIAHILLNIALTAIANHRKKNLKW